MDCIFCCYKIKGKRDLEIHCRKHTQERPYICSECQQELHSKRSLKRHLETHKPLEEREKLECPHCSKVLLSKVGLRLHIKSNGEERRSYDFACNVCDKAFSSKINLKNHKEGAHGEKRHGCHICGKLFTWKMGLHKHLHTHAAERERFQCTKCPKSFIKKSAYEEHRHIHQDQEYSFHCDKCDRRFFTSSRLKDHKRAVHSEKTLTFSCVFCNQRFEMFCRLERHLLSHILERPHLCKLCPAEFRRKFDLCLHNKKIHREEKFQCVMCPKAFKLKRYFNNHIRQHMGELCCKCRSPGCGMQFVSYDKRKLHHLKVHVGKRFPCTVCEKKFLTKSGLKRHCLVHSDLKGTARKPRII